MSVISLDELKEYISSTGTRDDALLTTILAAAQTRIETYCGRGFEGSSGVRYYREEEIITLPVGTQYRSIAWPPGGGYSWDRYPASGAYLDNAVGHQVLWLGKDLLSVTTLTNGDSDATVVTSTQYWLEPRNDPPYQYIRLKSANQWIFGTDGEVTVDGIWGYSTAAPGDIVLACKELAKYMYKRRDVSNYDVTAVPELGIVSTPGGIPKDVVTLIEPYKRPAKSVV